MGHCPIVTLLFERLPTTHKPHTHIGYSAQSQGRGTSVQTTVLSSNYVYEVNRQNGDKTQNQC